MADPGTVRPIDHIVVAVRDLDAARSAWARLGFTLAPVARHPFGTANSVIQLDRSYIELLAVADPARVPEPTPTVYSFAAFNRGFLAEHEGPSMLGLGSTDAAADLADFAARGLRTYDLVRFERTARGPDGSERPLAFTLAFTSDARIRDAGFFTCQHHHPENFWRPEYRRHANGARAVDSLVMVARDPADFHEFLTYFTGRHDMRSTSLGVTFDLGDGKVEVMSPVAVSAFFGLAVPADPKPHFVALRIAVADLGATRAKLDANGVAYEERAGALVVPPAGASGAAVAFVSGSSSSQA